MVQKKRDRLTTLLIRLLEYYFFKKETVSEEIRMKY